MARLIDGDALIAWIKGSQQMTSKMKSIICYIKTMPTVNAVSVVRCKDCKHWHDHITTTWCSRGAELRPQESGWIKRNADDFCSYGERKESE